MADKIIETLLAQIDTDLLIEEIRRRLGLGAGVSAGDGGDQQSSGANGVAGAALREMSQPGHIRADEFFRLSNPEAIRKFLGIMKRPQNPRSIVDGLKAGGVLSHAKNFYATIWTELKRAEARGELVNTPSGWGLSEWYAGRAKPTAEPKKPKKKRMRTAKKKADQTPSAPAQSAGGKLAAYNSFMAEQFKQGKSRDEANDAWRAHKEKA